MTFERAVEFILAKEGGHVNDPQDPGGATAYGISQRAYPDLDIASLTRDQAISIYHTHVWDRLKIEMMPDRLRLPFFDCAINQGPGFATLTLQRIAKVTPDGIIGYVTLAALVTRDIEQIRREYILKRMEAYKVARNWPHFGAGWATRLLEVALHA
jgi:lysozyme family protein